MSFDSSSLLKISDFAQVKGGKRMPTGTSLVSQKTKHPYIRIVDFKDGSIDKTNLQFVPDDVFPKISRYVITSDDLYISIVGTIGLVGTVPDELSGANLTENVAKICQIDISKVNRDYLGYFLRSDIGQNAISALAVGSTQPKLALFRIEQIEVPCPPIQIQREIAETLGTIDNRIALLRETNATLEAIAQALFKSWFVDFDPVHANQSKNQGANPAVENVENKEQAPSLPPEIQALFPATFTDSTQGPIPEGWSWKTLDEAYEINPKRLLKKGVIAKYLDMASVQTRGHVTEEVIEREFGSGTKFCNGDTLLARITPCLENGKTAFVDFLEPNETGWGSTEFVVLKPKAPLPDFHGYLLARQSVFREFAIRSMSGTSGRQRVQNDVLGSFYLAIPEEPIAAAFTQIVTPIQQSISANHKQAKTLAALRDTLLPRLISGKLRLPDAQAILEEDIYAAK